MPLERCPYVWSGDGSDGWKWGIPCCLSSGHAEEHRPFSMECGSVGSWKHKEAPRVEIQPCDKEWQSYAINKIIVLFGRTPLDDRAHLLQRITTLLYSMKYIEPSVFQSANAEEPQPAKDTTKERQWENLDDRLRKIIDLLERIDRRIWLK